jgi:hypothetical protein
VHTFYSSAIVREGGRSSKRAALSEDWAPTFAGATSEQSDAIVP